MDCEEQIESSVSGLSAQEAWQEFRLSSLEQSLVQEALLLLVDARTRAMELTAEMCQKRRLAVPGVHDFHLPAVLHLLRRFGASV
ncbi:hypothetical protein M3I54_21000 [Paraburkholderia sp. CNPSo 3274]|uniref:hypothetical protein n=1 Tax=Paraburkholderia sp. CNPSo 3274 TaxID=2940932 RepID=UPI0020B7B20C|nr:hypothetical protein [Paraburkholderia sp. CNPSo 3274]MCP3709435.1 hypothetical protein [Paraburkholderia sp. CNPSo 3274]